MREYRTGASLGPLIGWNLIAALAIVGLLAAAANERSDERWTLFGFAGLGILMGPVSLIAYLIRYFMVRVELGPEGLVLSKRSPLPWSEIQSVELRGWRPGSWNPFKSFGLGGCGWVGVIFLIKILVAIFVVVIVLWIVRTVLLPVVVLYSPWQSRVVIERRDGARLVYRDLADAEEFVAAVREMVIRNRRFA